MSCRGRGWWRVVAATWPAVYRPLACRKARGAAQPLVSAGARQGERRRRLCGPVPRGSSDSGTVAQHFRGNGYGCGTELLCAEQAGSLPPSIRRSTAACPGGAYAKGWPRRGAASVQERESLLCCSRTFAARERDQGRRGTARSIRGPVQPALLGAQAAAAVETWPRRGPASLSRRGSVAVRRHCGSAVGGLFVRVAHGTRAGR